MKIFVYAVLVKNIENRKMKSIWRFAWFDRALTLVEATIISLSKYMIYKIIRLPLLKTLIYIDASFGLLRSVLETPKLKTRVASLFKI